MTAYNTAPDCSAREKIIAELCRRYTSIRRGCAGKSVCGRYIDVLHIGAAPSKTLYCGGFHGSEYLTVLALLKFSEECAASLESGGSLSNALRRSGVAVVPCVNPDGVEIALHGSAAAMKYKPLVDSLTDRTEKWQANARGIDINHNFNAGWCALKQRELERGINGPAPTRFGGTGPESEPETKALTRLCRNSDFGRALALHSQGREIYCSFGEHTPVSGFRLASLLSQASGYNIGFPEAIATGGGFKDWFIEYFHKPAFTVEMGMGVNPLPLSDFSGEYEILRKLLTLGITAA